jgi:hypothetical protein
VTALPAWIRRLLGGPPSAPPAPEAPRPVPRRADEVAAVEAALARLLGAGLRLGAHYRGLSEGEAARRMAGHPAFAGEEDDLASRAPEALALDILWSERGLDDGVEDEFDNAALLPDHVYDGAGPEDYADVLRRIAGLNAAWRDAPLTATARGGAVHVSVADGPPLVVPMAKDFDWSAVARLGAGLPPGETRRFGVVADGGAALVVLLEPRQMRELERVLGWPPHALAES